MESSRVVLSLLVLILVSSSLCFATQVSRDGRALLIDGQRRLIISGSIHYPRSTPEMWPDLIQKAKEGGLNAIETYVFWNIHEPRRHEYNFDGQRDLVRFLKTIQEAGLYAVLRIGPYACAEWNYGGLPVWLHQMPGIQIRTDNEIFKNEMQTFTTLIVDMIKQENLLAPQGGPIIMAQIENEYGNIMRPYSDAGKRYIQWCAQMAEAQNVGVPWIMCQQADAPQPMINTCNGFYCDNFSPNNNSTSPKMWTENWTGWFKKWGEKDPHRPAEDIAYAVARFFQRGGSFQNYYMYHGGTNFGRTSGGPFVVTSYDYDAPLDEYGNLRQPKWGHLKQLHEVLFSMEKVLTYGQSREIKLGKDQLMATIYALNGTKSACFLSNTDGSKDYTVNFQGRFHFLPSWSVSILPTCEEVVYNTATITTQTSLMVKKPNSAEDEPAKLTWLWQPENIMDTIKGDGTFTALELLEQKNVTGDVSDYLWYMTSVTFNEHDPIYSKTMTLRVNTTGHVLHAFFNGKHVGSRYNKSAFVLEAPVTVRPHKNYLTLLSATVGLGNYGSFYDLAPAGIVGGPVELVGNGNLTMNLSRNPWTYKVGLNGEVKRMWDNDKVDWHYEALPLRRRMTWYKTAFKAPLGEDPVVVNLQDLQKGEAWVNGVSIGRFWTTYVAPSDCKPCNYRGTYNPGKCANGCGEPTQQWYHVPRSLLEADNNSLVVFEEMGGSPLSVNFQTVTVGSVCVSVGINKTLELECPRGRSISKIEFAHFGNTQGTCGSYHVLGSYENVDVTAFIKQECVGKTSCSIPVTTSSLGDVYHNGDKLTVQAAC